MNKQSDLRINRSERRFLGVCAGLADYLDVPAVLVRIIFVISVITWPTLIIGYFLLYFCLDNNITSSKIQEFFSSNGSDHFRKLDYRRPIYRNMNNKRIAGVCSGIADYLEVGAFWVRAAAVLSIFVFGPYAFLAYIIGWVVLEPNVLLPRSERSSNRESRVAARQARRAARYQRHAERHLRRAQKYIHKGRLSGDYQQSPLAKKPDPAAYAETPDVTNDNSATACNHTLDECAGIFYEMETRMRQIEAYITSKRFRLHCEINRA